jgi:hypothetical protein
MFNLTTSSRADDDRPVIVATSHARGLTRYSWTWTGGTQIAVADRAAETPFDSIGVYDHETGRVVIHDDDSFIEFLSSRYADQNEIDALEATWQASLY